MRYPFSVTGQLLRIQVLVLALFCAAPNSAIAINLGLQANPNPSTTGSYTITWNNYLSGTYRLQERIGGTGPWASIHFTANGSSFEVTDKPPGEYHYRLVLSYMECPRRRSRLIREECEFIDSFSETIVVNVANAAPAKPQNFSTTPAPETISGPTMVRDNEFYSLHWSGVTGAASYELQERLDESLLVNDPDLGIWKTIYTGSATTTEMYAKKIESIWSYRVRACDLDGLCGDWSDTRQVIVFLWAPPPEPPPPPPTEEEQIESVWSGFSAALDSGDVAAAMQFVSPTVRTRYEPALLALGDNVRDLTNGWSEIKAISVGDEFAEFTVYVTRNGQTRLHIIAFQLQEGVWRLLEF